MAKRKAADAQQIIDGLNDFLEGMKSKRKFKVVSYKDGMRVVEWKPITAPKKRLPPEKA